MKPRQLAEMVVVITGASSGIGRELAIRLSERNAKLILAARRMDRLEALNTQLGGKHQILPTDVSSPTDCINLMTAAIARHGRVDTVVCNAGYGISKSVAATTAEEFAKIFQTNLFGTTDVIRAAIPIMLQQPERDGFRGQILIVSSAVARRGLPFFGAYSATKAAQLSIAEALRVELKPSKIAVTSVHPVGTETEFFDLAGKYGDAAVPPPVKGEIRQTAATVARKMTAAIEKPRPEVWPLRSARFGISIATLVPGLVDRALLNYRRPRSN